MSKSKKNKINWQPISKLALFASHIDGRRENSEDQYRTLMEAKDKPHVLDDALVVRVIRLYQTQLQDIKLEEKQLERWLKLQLSDEQKQEIDRLNEGLNKTKATGEAILKLADYLKDNTIEKVLGKSDAELGLEFLLGKSRF